MKQRTVGIRELKSKLSECVRDVKVGLTIVVTKHGWRIARIVPEAETVDERLRSLRNLGAILWSCRRLGKTKPTRLQGKRTPTLSSRTARDPLLDASHLMPAGA